MSGWAFGSDKDELTDKQRERVKREILALASEASPYAAKVIRQVAERVGRGR
jgi:hypothetical protein